MSLYVVLLAALLGTVSAAPPVDERARLLAEIRAAASKAEAAGDSAGAVAALERGLKIDPNWKFGLLKAGRLLYQTEQYAAARSYLTRLTQVDNSLATAWALLGMCEFQLGDYRAVIEHIDRADRLGIPEQSGFRGSAGINMGLAYVELGDYEAAIELLNKLVPSKEPRKREQITTAFGYASMHLSLKATLSSEEAAVLHRLGEAYYLSAAGDRRGARAVLADLIKQYPKATALHFVYANLLMYWSDFEAANLEFRAELANDPESYPARLGLAYVAVHGEEAPESLRWATEAAPMRPDLYQSHFYLGQLLLRHDQAKEACAELEAACRLAPAQSGVRYWLAKAYRALGRIADAERELKEFERLKALEEPGKTAHTVPGSADAAATAVTPAPR